MRPCKGAARCAPPRIAARVTHVPGDLGPGLTALADALLRTTADPALDDAFRIAHNFKIVDAQIQTRRRALEQAATHSR